MLVDYVQDVPALSVSLYNVILHLFVDSFHIVFSLVVDQVEQTAKTFSLIVQSTSERPLIVVRHEI